MEKIVVITGANSGIGKAAAFKFAKEGYRVVMACRNIQTSESIRQEIEEKCNNKSVDLMQLDISSKQSIKHFCDAYKNKYLTLDILIHNAGHFKHGEKQFQQSADGVELTFATNLLGPFMMTKLLVAVLAKADNPVVLNCCSTSLKYFFDERRKINFDMLCNQENSNMAYDSYQLYGDSKVALVMATFKMAQEYKQYGICVNALMIPATKMSKQTIKKFKSYWKFVATIQQPFVPGTAVIGNTYFSICTSENFKGVSGALFDNKLQTMKVADQSLSYFKAITESHYYPCYIEDNNTIDKVWRMCNEFV